MRSLLLKGNAKLSKLAGVTPRFNAAEVTENFIQQ
jgi:hypothetical protein